MESAGLVAVESLAAPTNINDLGPQCLQHVFRQENWVSGSATTILDLDCSFCSCFRALQLPVRPALTKLQLKNGRESLLQPKPQ
jgi:hypothetical protein